VVTPSIKVIQVASFPAELAVVIVPQALNGTARSALLATYSRERGAHPEPVTSGQPSHRAEGRARMRSYRNRSGPEFDLENTHYTLPKGGREIVFT
jgi:hypothetical protein